MDYKKIIKSRNARLKILRFLSFVPDKTMLKIQYRVKTGHRLNLKNPKRFTEKLQWYKLYYKNPLMIQCVDKYDVREYVRSKGLESILNQCYGVYNSVDDIDWNALPERFVIKDTLGGGGNSVILVDNKKIMDFEKIKNTCQQWTSLNAHRKDAGREWPYYSGKQHRIIIEKFLESDPLQGGLVDYKFFCFNGKPTWMYIVADRDLGNKASLGIFDCHFKKQDVFRNDESKLTRTIEEPTTFEKMKEIARELSGEFLETRIDLYEVCGEVKFGEITFFDGSGYMKFTPDEFDYIMGESFNLKKFGGGTDTLVLLFICYAHSLAIKEAVA